MAIATKNFTGRTWGLAAESGGAFDIEEYSQDVEGTVYECLDEQGETKAIVNYNRKHAISASGTATGALSLAILDSVTYANEVAGLGGATGGTTLLMKVGITKRNTEPMKVRYEATRWTTLTVA
jgi:hypothetical protein